MYCQQGPLGRWPHQDRFLEVSDLRTGRQRTDQAEPCGPARVSKAASLPGRRHDNRSLRRLRRGSHRAPEARRRRRAVQHAVANRGGREGQGPNRVGHRGRLIGFRSTAVRWTRSKVQLLSARVPVQTLTEHGSGRERRTGTRTAKQLRGLYLRCSHSTSERRHPRIRWCQGLFEPAVLILSSNDKPTIIRV